MAIDLNKRAEKVGIILAKHNINVAPTVRVGAALDISGSTESLYRSGVMQETVDRLLAIAMKFDDNGEIDMWSFTSGYDQLEHAEAKDYGDYVTKNILQNRSIEKWGGTRYAPVMNNIVEFYFDEPKRAIVEGNTGFLSKLFGKKETTVAVVQSAEKLPPAMVMFITDGVNDDRDATRAVLERAKDENVYWQLVGVGSESQFGFLKELADKHSNIGYVNFASLDADDDVIYEKLITTEFCDWVKKLSTTA